MKSCKGCKHYKTYKETNLIFCEFIDSSEETKCVKDVEDFAIAELENIKAEIIKGKCKHCDIDSNIQKCLEDKFTICEVYDIMVIIDGHIAELKGKKNE